MEKHENVRKSKNKYENVWKSVETHEKRYEKGGLRSEAADDPQGSREARTSAPPLASFSQFLGRIWQFSGGTVLSAED